METDSSEKNIAKIKTISLNGLKKSEETHFERKTQKSTFTLAFQRWEEQLEWLLSQFISWIIRKENITAIIYKHVLL